MEELVVSLLLWLNVHGFPACTGQPEIRHASNDQAHGYMAWYQNGVVDLSERFDYDGLVFERATQRVKLARSALLHELVHFCQAQREGVSHPYSERAWLQREQEAYALQTIYLRENGSSTVLAWRRDYED